MVTGCDGSAWRSSRLSLTSIWAATSVLPSRFELKPHVVGSVDPAFVPPHCDELMGMCLCCVWANVNIHTGNHLSLLLFCPVILSYSTQLAQLHSGTSRHIKSHNYHFRPAHSTLILLHGLSTAAESRQKMILSFLIKHLFDKRHTQPAALQLETLTMEREGILILESGGMESTQNGIFTRDDAIE